MVTITDVAHEAQVSIATVSRVLNNNMQVIPETREKVMMAVEKLGYEMSPRKKYMLAAQKKLILVIMHTTMPSLFNAIQMAAEAYGYQVLFNLYNPASDIHILNTLDNQQISGVILSLPLGISNTLSQAINHYPVVQLLNSFTDFEEKFNVIADEEKMAYDAVSHLIERGCKNIGLITLSDHTSMEHVRTLRDSGYQKALMDSGLRVEPSLTAYGDYTYDGGFRATADLMNRDTRPDAIFCICDMMAIGCLSYLNQNRIIVPDQIAIASIDNMEVSEFTCPPLTTIDCGSDETAFEAVKLLHSIIIKEARRGRTVCIHHQLVIRQST